MRKSIVRVVIKAFSAGWSTEKIILVSKHKPVINNLMKLEKIKLKKN
jgi:hypothetical protein